MCRDSIGYNLTPCDICALCLFVLIFFLLLPSSADQKNKEIDIRKIVSILFCAFLLILFLLFLSIRKGGLGRSRSHSNAAFWMIKWLREHIDRKNKKKQKRRMTKKPIYGCHLSRSNPNKPIFLFSFFFGRWTSSTSRSRDLWSIRRFPSSLDVYTLWDGPRGWALRVWIVL